MFKIIDISMTIEDGMTVYKNKEEKKPKIYNSSNFQTGRTHETRIDLDCHVDFAENAKLVHRSV